MRRTRLTAVLGFVFLLLIAAPAYLLNSEATTLPNSAPVAVQDFYTVHGSLLLKPMQNDFDPDGDSISFVGIATQPQHGWLSLVRPGEYTYFATVGYVGTDSFTYTIRDTPSGNSTGTVNINVVNQAPVANTDSYTVHGSLLLTPMQNDTDPDGDSFTFVGIATQPQHGWLSLVRPGEYTYFATAGYVGTDSFTYTLRDNLSAESTGTVNINVVNQAPVANADFYTVHGSLLLKPMQNDSDPDGDSFTFVGIATQVQHGTLNFVRPGEYTYIATAGYVGPDSFTYTLRDNLSANSTGTVNINVVNQAPVANTDSYTVHGSLLLTPMQNDSDPDGDSFTFVGIATQVQHGTLNFVRPGEYTYIATAGYVGTDSFTYTLRDNLSANSTGTVNINVVNQAPIALADFYVVPPNVVLTPVQNDTDPDGDSFTFIGIATQPQHGWLNLVRPGEYTYTPTAGYSGSDSFTYTIRDSLSANTTGTVDILVLPGPGVPAKVPYACCPTDPAVQSSFNPLAGGLSRVLSGLASAFGPQYGDPVNLATGRESYTPGPDLAVYNPSGPAVVWQRSYSSDRALASPGGYGSPGFTRGWVHNYDVSIQGVSGSWGALKLVYPTGAIETLTPQLSGGVPTGAFTTPAGAPYRVEGVSGSPAGTWQSVTVTWKDQTKWKFMLLSGTTYALNQITNRTGQSLNFSWTSNRALTQVSDAGSGAVLLTLSYGASGRLSLATDTYGRQVAYTFNAGDSLNLPALQTVSQVVTSGTPNPPPHWTYGYAADRGWQLNAITVPSPTGSGNSTATINYDTVGRVSSLVDANGNQRVYTYNTTTTVVQVKDSANNVALSWTQKFDTSGRNTGITDAANHSTTIVYSDTTNPSRPTSMTDRNGHVTSYTYDSFGNVLTVTTPRVTTTNTWSYANFALGRLTSVQEGSKPATTISYYEPSGLVQTITGPEPNNGAGTTTTTFTYDSLGNVLTVVTPGNNAATSITTTLNYTTDGAYSQSAKIGQPLTITDDLSHVKHLRYDSQGRTISVTDALGNETDVSYNLIGQLLTTTNPATGQTGSGNSHSTNTYLYTGGPLSSTTFYDESNAQVRQVSRAYGFEGELLTVSGSTEPVTYTYDAVYRLKTLQDGNSNTTTYTYNNIGRPSSITMPGSEVTQFTSYDNNGNLLQRIDGNSVTTNYVYNDAESLLTDIQYPASTSLNVHFSYDSFGRRSGMTDSTGSQSYGYGNLDELLSVTTTYTGLSAKTVSYTYYPDGSRESMTTPAGTFDYSYDAAGRPASMTNPFSETTSWSFQNNNWLQTQILDNGATANYTYNAMGQVTRLLNQIGSTTISDFSSIGYDGVGNRLSVTASIPGDASLDGNTSYTYDSKNQLTQEDSTRNGGFTDHFGYDSAGNPTSFKGVTKSYNSNNQQTGIGFTHDGNGNPTGYGGVTLTFDPENRMTAYGSVLTAGYTGDGLRAWKQNASGRTYFLYDGLLPTIELDSSGNVLATNSFGANGLISRNETTTVFYSFDSEGNLVQRHESNGNVASNHLFDSHGASTGGILNEPFGYKAQIGYYTDNETGLQLLSRRYYDRAHGRFLTRDPVSYSGGINLYAYVRNNPVRWLDPEGTDIWGIAIGGSAAAGLGDGTMTPVIGGSGSTIYGYNTTDGTIGTASGYGYFGTGTGNQGTVIGSSASIGVTAAYSNANDWNDLSDGFITDVISLGPLSIEIDRGANGIFVVQAGFKSSIGGGWSWSRFDTYTPPESIGTLQGLGCNIAEEIEKLYRGN